jgi:hypothetical protein
MPAKITTVPVKVSESENLPSGLISKLSMVRASASSIVPYASYAANRIGKLGIVGLSMCMFSVIAFVSTNVPLRQELASQTVNLDAARSTAADERSGRTSATPQQHATNFVASLPTPNDVPIIMGSIVAVAAATGIELESGTYEYVLADSDSIARYQMSLPVIGSYPQVRKFIENVLAAVPAVALESMRLERDSVGDQVVAADLKFSILLGATP